MCRNIKIHIMFTLTSQWHYCKFYFHTGPILNITCMMLYCISHFAYVDMKDYGMYVISASHKINAILRGV